MSEAGDSDSNDSHFFVAHVFDEYHNSPSTLSSSSSSSSFSSFSTPDTNDLYMLLDNCAPTSLTLSDRSDAHVNVENSSNPADDIDDDTSPNGDSMDEFFMRKMEDRPPRYEDIENDRIASPESYGQAPIADSYDQAPIADSYGQSPIADSYDQAPIADSYNQAPFANSFVGPPPEYDEVPYTCPRPLILQSNLVTFVPRPPSQTDAVVQPNRSTVTEVTAAVTTPVVAIRQANPQERIRSPIIYYTNCTLPRRSNGTYTTVYRGPKMTTAVIAPDTAEVIASNREEVAQRRRRQYMTVSSMRRTSIFGTRPYDRRPTGDEQNMQRNRYCTQMNNFCARR